MKTRETERTSNSNSAMPDEPKAMKSELLDSFIEDCMRSTNGLTHKEINSPIETGRRNFRLSGRDHPGTVETLKHMLLNLNGVASSQSSETRGQTTSAENTGRFQEVDESTDDTSSLPGEQSLTRAYHHLARLKSLISNRVELNSDG